MSLRISTAPHMHNPLTTQRLMQYVCIALLPTAAWGVYAFGLPALLVLGISMAGSVLAEFVWQKIAKQPVRINDFSALVTGLILGLNLPATAPWWMVIIGAFFAIMIVKQLFGGLGDNFLNPALAARAVLLASWPVHMTASACVNPTFFQAGVDAVSTATPLGAPGSYTLMQLFLGQCPGAIGEVSKAAILVGLLFLLVTKVISWRIPVIMTASVFCCTMLIGGATPEAALAAVLSGGVLFGAVFMATDYVTSPVTRLGQAIYGCLIGLLGGIFRLYGGTADSFSYCVITGNLFTPLIDHYIVSRPYAFTKYSIIQQARASGIPLYKRIPRPALVLTVIAAIAGLALSGVYGMTKDIIADQQRAAKAASYKAVCPDADHFETDEVLDKAIADLNGEYYNAEFGRVKINDAFVAKDADGNTTGYALSVTTADGYHGNITLAVGIDDDGSLNGISFTELNETAGLGMRVDEDAFKDQFDDVDVDVFKLNKAGGSTADDEIDSISGASTTSGAVVNAVNAALDFHEKTVMGGN